MDYTITRAENPKLLMSSSEMNCIGSGRTARLLRLSLCGRLGLARVRFIGG